MWLTLGGDFGWMGINESRMETGTNGRIRMTEHKSESRKREISNEGIHRRNAGSVPLFPLVSRLRRFGDVKERRVTDMEDAQ